MVLILKQQCLFLMIYNALKYTTQSTVFMKTATIGMVNDVLFVVYTERKQNIRLISARLANKTERSIYL
mgnify:CR=1 FL=1